MDFLSTDEFTTRTLVRMLVATVQHIVKSVLINITNNMNSINSHSFQFLQGLLHPDVKIVDVEVRNNYLRATLSSGVFFSVRNDLTASSNN